LEKRRFLPDCGELFASARIGATAFTFQQSSLVAYDSWGVLSRIPPLYPQASILCQVKCGLAYEHVVAAACFELMNWRASPEVHGWLQPDSQMLLVGFELGLRY
jgi:hypothetical protein